MKIVLTALAAVIPSILLLRFFFKRDLNPEPRGVLIKTFLLGVLIVAPVIAVALPVQSRVPQHAHPLSFGLYIAFLCAAVPEEFFKFAIVRGYSARHRAFDEPMDGVVYGATASLGFATLENIIYVVSGGWSVALLRAVTAVPGHACLGAILGYFVGQSRCGGRSKAYAWLGLLWAVLFHGLYNFPFFVLHGMALQNRLGEKLETIGTVVLAYAFCLAVLAVEIFWVWKIVRKLRREQIQSQVDLICPLDRPAESQDAQ